MHDSLIHAALIGAVIGAASAVFVVALCRAAAIGDAVQVEPRSNGRFGPYCFGSTVWPGLSKLVEEMGELGQVLGKLIQTGGSTDHWSGDLRQMMIDEIGDKNAATKVFVELNNLDQAAIDARSEMKLALFRQWHEENLS